MLRSHQIVTLKLMMNWEHYETHQQSLVHVAPLFWATGQSELQHSLQRSTTGRNFTMLSLSCYERALVTVTALRASGQPELQHIHNITTLQG
jgi:hypothetical protein